MVTRISLVVFWKSPPEQSRGGWNVNFSNIKSVRDLYISRWYQLEYLAFLSTKRIYWKAIRNCQENAGSHLKMGRKQAPRNRKYNCLLTGTAWDGAIGDTLPRCVWLGTKTCCTKELATLGWVWMVLKFRIYSACNGPGVS